MTPTAKRVLEKILDEYDHEAAADVAASSMRRAKVTTAAIDREAIRLANIGRRGPRLILLGTLNPDSQMHYRELAKRNLEDK